MLDGIDKRRCSFIVAWIIENEILVSKIQSVHIKEITENINGYKILNDYLYQHFILQTDYVSFSLSFDSIVYKHHAVSEKERKKKNYFLISQLYW